MGPTTPPETPLLAALAASPRPAPLRVALSGGMDSAALLDALAQSPAAMHGLRAIHIHHGLQAQADAWATHCEHLCRRHRIALEVIRVTVPHGQGQGPEAAARQARYEALARAMDPGEILVTAHHRDDQAETFLLRALRGSGPEGLAAMRPWRRFAQGWHWRPWLGFARDELLTYARSRKLAWVEDPSNAQTDYDRNFLRHALMPVLRARWPHADAALARCAALCAEAAELLDEEDRQTLARMVPPTGEHDGHRPAVDALPLEAVRALGPPRRARLLRHWIASLGLPPLPAEGVARIERELLPAAHDSGAKFVWGDTVVRRWRDRLYAGRIRPPLPADWSERWDGRLPLVLPTGDILTLEGDEVLPAAWRVMARRGGERIMLPGRRHTHALKKLLQVQDLPPWERERLPLLVTAQGELMAAGDRIVSAHLQAWLDTHGARLHWRRNENDPAYRSHPQTPRRPGAQRPVRHRPPH